MNFDVKEFIELNNLIKHHQWKYFILSKPEISDAEFDLLCRKRDLALKTNPELKIYRDDSYVGFDPAPEFEKAKHIVPMLSLQNAFDNDDVEDFFSRIVKLTGLDSFEVVCEPKFDGVSFAARYIGGKYALGITRGNGEYGEVVTENILVAGIPNMLSGSNLPEILEIRGEIYVTKKDFYDLNKLILQSGGEPFSNARNLASGSIRQLDASIAKSRKLRHLAYSISVCNEVEKMSQTEILSMLKGWGFEVTDNFKLINKASEAIKYHQELISIRSDLPYEIDGAVYKINDPDLRILLGFTNKAPRWAIAHKFQSAQATTVVLSVDFQVGKSGVITPVANLNPVSLSGITITRVSLHNKEEIARLRLKQGSEVIIERSGDVIPRVVRVVHSDANAKEILFPDVCPSCGSQLIKEEIFVYCPNDFSCKMQMLKRIEHFCSRNAMGIDGLGAKTVDKLWNEGIIRSFVDIFRLESKSSEIEKMSGFGAKAVSKMISSINSARVIPLFRFLYAIALPNVGIGVAKLIEAKCKLDSPSDPVLPLINGSCSRILENISGVGPAISISCSEFFEKNHAMIEDLLNEITVI